MNTEAPIQIVILGGTGDLSSRKLLPALFDLFLKKRLPKKFSIIGTARRPYTDADYRSFVSKLLETHGHNHKPSEIKRFVKNIHYTEGSFDTVELYINIASHLKKTDVSFKTASNKLFYLAVPPQSYESIFKMLHRHKLHLSSTASHWSRILVEKPFGSDTKTAQKLDKQLGSLFKEEQIFRIDHYLAKEAVQNILSFRFANTLTQSAWSGDCIESISIKMHERLDVGKRGAFYDGIGTLRDVGQNHLLQLLALLTMDEPTCFDAAHIRSNRLAILKKLTPINKKTITTKFVRGQYEGYKKVTGVKTKSMTETFFELIAEVNTDRWRGVPIYLSAGKALNEDCVEVTIQFKDIASGLFLTHSCTTVKNQIRLTISPTQQMHITLNAKAPGLGYQLESRTLSFDCGVTDNEVTNSYEKVLLDCINGDQMLFTTTDEVFAQWKYINTILNTMEQTPLQTYKQGSGGPKKRLLIDI